LSRIFSEPISGLVFVENENQIKEAVDIIKGGGITVNTRQSVLSYSWDAIAGQVDRVYKYLIEEKN
jgi:hypothetical protein